jgi:hypothetical protein
MAIVLTVVCLLLAGGLVGLGGSHLSRLAIWPFATAAAVTWLQVVRRFCVRFGALGVENLGPLGNEVPVDAGVRAADRHRAFGLIIEGALVGAVVTLALVVLPI